MLPEKTGLHSALGGEATRWEHSAGWCRVLPGPALPSPWAALSWLPFTPCKERFQAAMLATSFSAGPLLNLLSAMSFPA